MSASDKTGTSGPLLIGAAGSDDQRDSWTQSHSAEVQSRITIVPKNICGDDKLQTFECPNSFDSKDREVASDLNSRDKY